MEMKTKSQYYSEMVFNNIQYFIEEKKDDPLLLKRYKSLCKRAGGVMRTVGLIHFLTFLSAKSGKPSEQHHLFLQQQLIKELVAIKIVENNEEIEFLAEIRRQDLPDYMNTSRDVLVFLQWHKRVSDILIEDNT